MHNGICIRNAFLFFFTFYAYHVLANNGSTCTQIHATLEKSSLFAIVARLLLPCAHMQQGYAFGHVSLAMLVCVCI